ncbi:MAG: alpha/beta hydrolase [Lacisediminihabitans sp.]
MRTTPLTSHIPGATVSLITVRSEAGGDAGLAVEALGDGPAVLLVHGFPHTRAIWRTVAPLLAAAGRRIIVPDLRGLGDSTRTQGGYEAIDLAADLTGVLDALGEPTADVVGIDLGVAPVFALTASQPARVRSMTLIEAMIGKLSGAEGFLAGGAPWWFGLHAAPGGLAEQVLAGNEERYVRFFLDGGTTTDFPDELARIIARAYEGLDSLRAAFEHYRAIPENAKWAAAFASTERLQMPVLAIGGGTVGDTTAKQLQPFTDNLTSHVLRGVGHIVPIDAPAKLAALLSSHFSPMTA